MQSKTTNQSETANRSNIDELKQAFLSHLEFSQAKDSYSAIKIDYYKSLTFSIRDQLIKKWLKSQELYYDMDVKRVYYLSMEFLPGRMMGNALINLNLYEETRQALKELGHNLEELQTMEIDAGLGSGGLGRLAACFLDSMATLGIPAYGYGIRYEYGMFYQKIINGNQVETSDNWSRYGNPWEITRPEHLYPVKFYGNVRSYNDKGIVKQEWIGTQKVMAMACDIPIPGYKNDTVINMRLWAAKSSHEFDLNYFQNGDYEKAVSNKVESETISKVLYPRDDVFKGKELRLKQEYFFVSATMQDIMRRYKKTAQYKHNFSNFSDKIAIQLNDTHPAIAIPELMRILIDIEEIEWDDAWKITIKTFGFTNHTILPEALEKWPVSLIERVLPRHLQIIYEINSRFLENIKRKFPDDHDRLRKMSVIEEGTEKLVNMANLAVVGSHSVNGVSAIHTNILRNDIFKDFYDIWPEKFNNKTNGITHRRWLRSCNPKLAELISKTIGEQWLTNLFELKKLIPFATDREFQEEWQTIKLNNKKRLAEYINKHNHINFNIDSMFDCHIKRIHEYKRQLLKTLHVISLYNQIKAYPYEDFVPRTVIFSGKAAPSYCMAKLIIKLINSIADVVNNDNVVKEKLKVVFVANYSVSLAEMIIPAIDLSEQISTAGTEASGTGNMKAALNGALTIGAFDGSNLEISEEVGDENIFMFGLSMEEIADLKRTGYNPQDYYHNNNELKQALDMIGNGTFSESQPDLFKPIIRSLLDEGDKYMVLADFNPYVKCQKNAEETFKDRSEWTRMSILNTANMGKFSSDQTIMEYAEEIWGVRPVNSPLNYY